MFSVNDRVVRLEARTRAGATVREIMPTGEETLYRIEYDEGGAGWWPGSVLEEA